MLSTQNEELQLLNTELRAENAQLKSEILELKARLAQDSSNSNQPPSSDGLKKKPAPAPAFSRKSAKKVGGQLGHEGHTLLFSTKVDVTHIHHASCCTICGTTFSVDDSHYQGIGERRQVLDMPVPRLEVTEHQLGIHKCCGVRHQGQFPVEVSARVQYGINIETLGSLLTTEYRLSYEKAGELLSVLYGCGPNVSTLATANKDLYEDLAPVEQQIRAAIYASPVAHFDETGMRVEGKLHWFHVVCTTLYCYFFVHAHRGSHAIQSDLSLLPNYLGRAVHDCWATYFQVGIGTHALCGAHLLRELTALIQAGTQWAVQMHAFLLEAYTASEKGTATVPDPATWQLRYKNICQNADKEEPAPVAQKRGKPKNTKGRNLYNRLVKHQEAVLAFALHKEVPFTNNLAEQAVRHLKVKQKISMSFRTLEGAKVYARIQGTINTIKKHNMNLFQTIKDIKLKKNITFKAS